MAFKNYKVKRNDTLTSLGNPQAILKLNPGVKKLSRGQTIRLPSGGGNQNGILPSWTGLGPMQTQDPNPITVPGANSFQSGSRVNTVNTQILPKPPVLAPFGYGNNQIQLQNPQPVTMTGANSFQSGNVVNTQDALQVMVNGFVAQPIAQTPSSTPQSTPSTILPAGYVYTGGNDELSREQRRLWNIAAGGTGNESVHLLTKQDIRNAKQAKRRRRGMSVREINELDAAQRNPVAAEANTGNAENASLSWRV